MERLIKIEINADDTKNIQCAACGYINDEKAFMRDLKNSYSICPNCGTLKYVNDITKHYRN